MVQMFDMCDNRFDSSRVVHLAERLIDVLIIRSSEEAAKTAAAKTAAEIEAIRKDVLSTFINDEPTKNEKYKEFIQNLTEKNSKMCTFAYDIGYMNTLRKNEDRISDVADKTQQAQILTFFTKVFKDLIVDEDAQLNYPGMQSGEYLGTVHLIFPRRINYIENLHIYFHRRYDVDLPEIIYWISSQ